jgi:glycosyltransferase involved in cell wall biosynthesis
MTGSTRIQLWFLIGSLKVSGCQTLYRLADRLDHDEFEITVWTLLPDEQNTVELPQVVTVNTLDARGKFDIRAAFEFATHVHRHSPDILHSFLYFDNLLARLSGIFAKDTDVISTILSVPTSQSSFRAGADRLTIRLCDHVVANSNQGSEFARKRGAPRDRVSVIPNGRDASRFRTASEPPELRDSLGIPAEATVIGNVARLIRAKGHADLISAWPRVKEAHPESHLLIVGDGPERGQLEALVAVKECGDSVTFAGLRRDIPELLATMDLFVFPSHYEGMPGAVIEAMAAGLPIVGTRVAGTSELIDDGKTGILVPAMEPDALVDGLDTLLSHPHRAATYGQNAAAVAAEVYSIEQMIAEYTTLYRRLSSPAP